MKYFELLNSKKLPVYCSGKGRVTLLAVHVLIESLTIVSVWKVNVGFLVIITVVSDIEIGSTSEPWPVAAGAVYQVPAILLRQHFLLEIKRK